MTQAIKSMPSAKSKDSDSSTSEGRSWKVYPPQCNITLNRAVIALMRSPHKPAPTTAELIPELAEAQRRFSESAAVANYNSSLSEVERVKAEICECDAVISECKAGYQQSVQGGSAGEAGEMRANVSYYSTRRDGLNEELKTAEDMLAAAYKSAEAEHKRCLAGVRTEAFALARLRLEGLHSKIEAAISDLLDDMFDARHTLDLSGRVPFPLLESFLAKPAASKASVSSNPTMFFQKPRT